MAYLNGDSVIMVGDFNAKLWYDVISKDDVILKTCILCPIMVTTVSVNYEINIIWMLLSIVREYSLAYASISNYRKVCS